MKISPTLSRYLARTYIVNTLFLLAALLGVIYLFDTVELMRRAASTDVPLPIVLQMSLLKLPEVGQMLLPFAILFGAMFTFWQLTRRYELIVVRAAGFSFWQFLAPVIGVAVVIGLLHISIINPISALLLGKFQQMENVYIKGRQENQIALFKEGLWLRQSTANGYVILHAGKIEQPAWKLKLVTALFFMEDDLFVKRVDADSASLEKGQWVFQNAVITNPVDRPIPQPVFILPTELTVMDIEKSFSSAATMSFWKLPGHIRTLEETGFDASPLKVYYQNLLSQPLMFAAMVLLAAAVSMRPPRSRSVLNYFAAGIFMGFVIFFMSSFLQALGASQQLPIVLAAWSPALISMLLGLSVMMNQEDG
jgi:lipopolysaccharide export system permease protein